MRGRGLVWPLLAYGVIGAIAAARPGGRLGGGGATPNDGSAERLEHLRRGDGRGANKKAERQHQSAHGRRADAPWQIPLRGWKDILWRVYAKINNDRLLAVAAGVVFYAILALFPALAALVSLYGLFADAHTIESTLSPLLGRTGSYAYGRKHKCRSSNRTNWMKTEATYAMIRCDERRDRVRC